MFTLPLCDIPSLMFCSNSSEKIFRWWNEYFKITALRPNVASVHTDFYIMLVLYAIYRWFEILRDYVGWMWTLSNTLKAIRALIDFDIQDYDQEAVPHRYGGWQCVCVYVFILQMLLIYKVNFLWINILTQSSSKKMSPLEYYHNYIWRW